MTTKMERILGGAIGYARVVPGTIPVDGKVFVYFEDDGINTFKKQFVLLTQYAKHPNAQSGGVISQGCALTLPDGSLFHAISYHGDIVGWEKDLAEGARGLHVVLATIDECRIVVADGRQFDLSDCKAEFT